MPSFSNVLKDACYAAGEILVTQQGHAEVKRKGERDLVTSADFAAQKAAWRIIQEAFPDHRLLAEENITDPGFNPGPIDSDCRWILDPLDGTINYVHGSPHFCVSLAFEQKGELLLSGIYAPRYNEFFTAVVGSGSRIGFDELKCSKTQVPLDALGAFGFPFDPEDNTPDFRAFVKAKKEFQALRRTGSIALNLAYVAAGRFDAFWTFAASPWDVAAGALLVQESGGTLTGPQGDPFDVDRAHLVCAGTPELHREILKMFGGRP